MRRKKTSVGFWTGWLKNKIKNSLHTLTQGKLQAITKKSYILAPLTIPLYLTIIPIAYIAKLIIIKPLYLMMKRLQTALEYKKKPGLSRSESKEIDSLLYDAERFKLAMEFLARSDENSPGLNHFTQPNIDAIAKINLSTDLKKQLSYALAHPILSKNLTPSASIHKRFFEIFEAKFTTIDARIQTLLSSKSTDNADINTHRTSFAAYFSKINNIIYGLQKKTAPKPDTEIGATAALERYPSGVVLGDRDRDRDRDNHAAAKQQSNVVVRQHPTP